MCLAAALKLLQENMHLLNSSSILYSIHFFSQGTREEWQKVFFLAAAIYALGGVLFIILARGELQPWAVEESDRKDEKETHPLNDNHFANPKALDKKKSSV